jgi:hypothetical protein
MGELLMKAALWPGAMILKNGSGDTQLTIQQFNNSTINYCFSASIEMKHTHWRQFPLP